MTTKIILLLSRKKSSFAFIVGILVIIALLLQELLVCCNGFIIINQFKEVDNTARKKHHKKRQQQQRKPLSTTKTTFATTTTTTTRLNWSKYIIPFECDCDDDDPDEEKELEGGNKSERRIRNCTQEKIEIFKPNIENNNNNINADDDDDDKEALIPYTSYYDLSSPREWLEYWEIQFGNEGAYTVIRCDYDLSTRRWNVWGSEFHFQRLKDSLIILLSSSSSSKPILKICNSTESIDNATKSSLYAMDALLKSAEEAIVSSKSISDGEEEGNIVTFMMTLLWNPDKDNDQIQVLTHVFSSLLETKLKEYNPDLIVASVAAISSSSSNDDSIKINKSATTTIKQKNVLLPNRYQYMPSAKLSSWCRRRRPLETMFKRDGIGEVLLIREDNDDEGGIMLLEGLTTNLFVVYKDGSIRTANTNVGVLNGYASHLIIQCGHQHFKTLNIETTKPIKLEESDQWQEIFITSSIRLIVPIREIVVLVNNSDEGGHLQEIFHIIWKIDHEQTSKNPVWRQLYERICCLDIS